MASRQQDRGSTSAIGIGIAAALFAVAFTAANLMVEKPGGIDQSSATLDRTASTGLEVIVGQAGMRPTGAAWLTNPDDMARFGLAAEGEPNFLDYLKIKAMRNGSMANAVNSAPDYPDVKRSLGILHGDFHLRTYPVLPSMEDPRWSKDARGRLAYVGHIGSAAGSMTSTTYANTSGSVLNVSVAIRNDGLTDHIFVANIGIGVMSPATIIKSDQRHTGLLAPGQVQTVSVEFPRMAYTPTVTGVSVQISDGYGGIILGPLWTATSAPATGTSAAWAPLLSAGQTYYISGETVNFLADHFEGDGSRMNSAQDGRFVLVGPDGNEWVNATVSLPKNKVVTQPCTNCTAQGTYTATLWDSGMTRKARDIVHVSGAPLFIQTETIGSLGLTEISLLKDLVVGFNGLTNTEANPEGDIFTDASHIRTLPDVLSRYSILVVGSEVRQNALNSGEIKWAIADWVQAGGNLIVLGTLDSQSAWLEPVYHAAQQTANGGISAPDPTHPVLKAPEKMDYQRYLDNGRAWNIKSDQPFTHVLTRGISGTSQDDTLAISAPGAYNDGTVVLTSYMAGALTSPQDDAEAKRFLHNLLSQSYTMLFLDYGPALPSHAPVGSAQRLVAVPHPNVPGAVVEARIVIYTWD